MSVFGSRERGENGCCLIANDDVFVGKCWVGYNA